MQRFNVAVTRARALLIVVGNPRVLTSDATWARYGQQGSLKLVSDWRRTLKETYRLFPFPRLPSAGS